MADDPKPKSELVLYQTEDGRTRVDVRLENETVWLSQGQMAELFQRTKQNVGAHVQNLFVEKELREDSVVKEFFTTAADGKNYQTRFYNLDVIISVGYRVKSLRGTEGEAVAGRAESEEKVSRAGGEFQGLMFDLADV